MTEENTMNKVKANKKLAIIIIPIIIALIIGGFLGVIYFPKYLEYEKAMELYNSGKYNESIVAFESLNKYKDSPVMVLQNQYSIAVDNLQRENYEEAILQFEKLKGYSNSEELLNESIYSTAQAYENEKEWEKAIDTINPISEYKDSKELIKLYKYNLAKDVAKEENWQQAISLLEEILDYRNSYILYDDYTYYYVLEKANKSDWGGAFELLDAIPNHIEYKELKKDFTYNLAVDKINNRNWDEAIALLNNIDDYKKSSQFKTQHEINSILEINPSFVQIEVPKEPRTVEKLEELLLYMASYNMNKIELVYDSEHRSDYMYTVYADNLYEAFCNAIYEYPDYFPNTGNYDWSYEILDGKTFVNIEFGNPKFNKVNLMDMEKAFHNEAYEIILDLIKDDKLTKNMTEKQRAEVLYRWLAYNLKYDLSLKDVSYTGYGAVINREAVCTGYTTLYNYLCRIIGIDVIAVANVDHIWTLATLDGEKFFIDSTWGDPTPDVKNHVNMEYFAVKDEFLSKSRDWDKEKYSCYK